MRARAENGVKTNMSQIMQLSICSAINQPLIPGENRGILHDGLRGRGPAILGDNRLLVLRSNDWLVFACFAGTDDVWRRCNWVPRSARDLASNDHQRPSHGVAHIRVTTFSLPSPTPPIPVPTSVPIAARSAAVSAGFSPSVENGSPPGKRPVPCVVSLGSDISLVVC